MKKSVLLCIGLIAGLIGTELLLRLGGYVFISAQKRMNTSSLRTGETVRILALGESTTALGEKSSAPGAPDTWPALLEAELNNSASGRKVTVINRGVPGITTTGILANLAEDLETYTPHIVVSMMGFNDGNVQTRSRTTGLYENFRVFKLVCYSWLWTMGTIPAQCTSISPWQISRSSGVPILNEQVLAGERNKHPDDPGAHIKLADFYINQGRYLEARASLEAAQTLTSCSDELFIRYGNIYRFQSDFQNAASMYQKAIYCNSQSGNAYGELGYLRILQGNDAEAEILLRKSAEYNPGNAATYNKIGDLFRTQKRYGEMEELAQSVIRQFPGESWSLVELEKVYRETDRVKEADELFQRAAGINSVVTENYRLLGSMLERKGIRLVAVQYPMRNAALLQAVVGPHISVVDNRQSFIDAIKKDGYAAYFTDRFGGDFGHATRKGNELIARNISAVVSSILP